MKINVVYRDTDSIKIEISNEEILKMIYEIKDGIKKYQKEELEQFLCEITGAK